MKEADYTEQKEVLRFLVYSVGTIDVEESGGEKETIEVDVPLVGGGGYGVKPVEFLSEHDASIGLINKRLLRVLACRSAIYLPSALRRKANREITVC